MTQPSEEQNTDPIVLREIDLGHHHLLLMSDQSIELIHNEQLPSAAKNVISLHHEEAYRLLICLKELFKEEAEP